MQSATVAVEHDEEDDDDVEDDISVEVGVSSSLA